MKGGAQRGESAIRLAVVNAEPAEGDGSGRRGATRDLRLARQLLNDAGNAQRLRTRYGNDLMFVPEVGNYAWLKTHWSVRHGDREWNLAAEKTAHRIRYDEVAALAEAEPEPQPGQSAEDAAKDRARAVKALIEWGVDSGNRPRLTAMQSIARHHLEIRVDQLDADPFLFNVQNGTLELGIKGDLAGVRLRRHARLDRITRIAPVGYDPEADCPRFRAFLRQIIPDESVARWLQKLFGYLLTGADSEHMLACFWGEGRNGKGTLTKLFLWLLGDYGKSIEFASLLADDRRRGSEATPDLARLAGARAAFASEPPKGKRLDDGRIKQITGGDTSMVRHLNREFFDLRPTFKLILSFNNKPRITDDSHGMWSRMRLVPFGVIIPDDQQDAGLLDKLKSEGPGVLNWALDGFRLWREGGLSPPEAILASTAEYRAESDVLGQFLEAATAAADEASRIRAPELYACYEGWCKAYERRPMSLTAFGSELTRRGIKAWKSNGVTYRLGLRFRAEFDWEWREPI